MAIFYDIKDIGDLRLNLAYGEHAVRGTRIKRRVEFVGNEKQVTEQYALGVGPWHSCLKLFWGVGHEIPADNFRFHQGLSTDAPDDLFPGDDPHPGVSYINVRLPAGMADEDDPAQLWGRYKTLMLANYDELGRLVDEDGFLLPAASNPEDYLGYSASPARVLADLHNRQAQLGKLLVVTPDAGADTFTASGHGLANNWAVRFFTAGILPSPLSPVAEYYVVGATANTFQVSATYGGPPINLTTVGGGSLLVKCAAARIIWADWMHKRDYDATLIPWNDGTTARMVPRFEAHLFFQPPFRLSDAFDKVCQVSCADWQRAGGRIRFMTPEPRTPVLTLDMTKIGKGTFKTYPIDSRRRPNRIRVNFRDLDSTLLSPAGTEDAAAPVVIDREAVQEADDWIIREHVVDGGCMTRSQAERVGHYTARTLVDLDQMAEYDAPPSAYGALPADVVATSHDVPEWNGVEFKILRKGEDDKKKAGYPLTLQLYSGAAYSDTDHGPLARPLPVDRPNPFIAPPPATSLTLTSEVRRQIDNSYIGTIHGSVQFAPFVGQQSGRVQWKLSSAPSNAWEEAPTRAVIPAPTGAVTPLLVGLFEIPSVTPGEYDVRVIAESSTAASDPDDAPVETVEVEPPPLDQLASPAGANGSVVDTQIKWAWTHVVDPDRIFSHYEAYSDAALTVLLYRGDANYFVRDIEQGVDQYDVYVVAVAKFEGLSSDAAHAQVSGVSVANVADFEALDWDGSETAELDWTENSDPHQRLAGYELYTEAEALIGLVRKPRARVRVSISPTVFKIKALDVVGNRSPAFASATFTNPVPAHCAVTGVTFDGSQIEVRWAASTEPGITHYLVYGADNIVRGSKSYTPTATANVFRFTPTKGVDEYEFIIIPVNRLNQALTVAGPGWPTAEGDTITAPERPAAAAATFDGLHNVWKLTASPSEGVTHYVAKNTSGNILADEIGLEWKQKVVAGTSAYTVRFYSVNAAGLISANYRETTFTVPVPADPTLTLTVAPELIRHAITPPASLPDGLEYDLARANDGTQIISRQTRSNLDELLAALSPVSRTFTRYARAINIAGRLSGWATASVNYQPITAAPTLTQDTARANQLSLPVHVSTPVNREYVRAIVVQVRASGAGSWPSLAEGTTGTFRYPGSEKTVWVHWAAGGAVEFRVALEDALTAQLADHVWSTTQAYTFTKFNDGALDPTSSFLQKANYRDPIYSGGGTIEWTAAFAVKWSQPIIINGVGTVVSSSGTVTIPANTAGTTLSAGQMIIAVQTLGATTATLQTVTLSTYTPPDENSTTVHRRLFARLADDSLATYLGVSLQPGRLMEARVLIPYLTTFDADIGVATITKANIKSINAGQIDVDVVYARIVFGDKIGSTDYVPHGSQVAQTENITFQDPENGTLNSAADTFTKTAATGTWGDARAKRLLFSGDGEAVFVIDYAAGSTSAVVFGLSYDDTNAGETDIDFGIYPQPSTYSGTGSSRFVAKRDGVDTNIATVWALGDSVKITVESAGTVVKAYHKPAASSTWTLIHTYGGAAPRFPLMLSVAAYLVDQVVSASAFTLKGLLAPANAEKVPLQNVVGFSYDASDDLSGGLGSDAESIDTYTTSVSVSHVIAETNKNRSVGFRPTSGVGNLFRNHINFQADGIAACYENNGGGYALLGGSGIAYSAADVWEVRNEGGTVKYLKNGVLQRTSTLAFPAAGMVITVVSNENTATIKTLRVRKVGAQGQGWMAPRSGDIEARSLKLGDYKLATVEARAAKAHTDALQYLGNDRTFPLPHKVTALRLDEWDVVDDGTDDVTVALGFVSPEPGADAFAGFDSVYRVKVRVFNQFGEYVTQRHFDTSSGEVSLPSFRHTRLYADPADQAVYEVSFRNALGWSLPLFLKGGVKSETWPTLIERAKTFLSASAGYETGLIFGHFRQTPTGVIPTIQIRQAGSSTWEANNSGASSSDEYWSIACRPGVVYDVRFYNPTYGTYSNYRRVRTETPAQLAEQNASPPIYSLKVWSRTATAIKMFWRVPYISGVTATNTTVFRSTNGGAFSQLYTTASQVASYEDTTVTAGSTYRYYVEFTYTAPREKAVSPVVACLAELAAALNEPSNLRPTLITATQINTAWSVGTNTAGAVSLDWKVVGAGDDPNTAGFWSGHTTVSLAANTTAYPHTGRTAGVTYAYRVRVSGSTNASNVISVTAQYTSYKDPAVT